jgi:hypothetical protein
VFQDTLSYRVPTCTINTGMRDSFGPTRHHKIERVSTNDLNLSIAVKSKI